MSEAENHKNLVLNPFSSAALAMQIRPPMYVLHVVTLAICCMTAIALLFAIGSRYYLL